MGNDFTKTPEGPIVMLDQNINQTLKERGSRYGSFEDQARIGGHIVDAMRDSPNWSHLPYYQKEALTTIACKIARALNGDPTYLDNWHDIAGYATLVEKTLKGEKT